MAKAKKWDNGNEDKGAVILCPACNCYHYFNKGWKFNEDYDRPTFSPSMIWKGQTYPSGGVCPTDEEDARLMAGEILEMTPLVCHSFVREGKIQFLTDCTHTMAGKTVDLPEVV